MEVIVVDNASADGSAEMVAAEFPQVRLLRQRENLMFARGMNAGARAAVGRYLLFLNSDCFVTPATLAEMVSFMDQVPTAGLVSPRLVDAQGRLEPGVTCLTGIGRTVRKLLLWPRDWSRARLTTGAPAQAPTLAGPCLMGRREVMLDIGLYDETFTLGAEDTDLCYRVRRSGHGVWYLPGCCAVHLNSYSRDKLGRVVRDGHLIDGQIRFAHKHYSLGYRRVWAALEIPLLVRDLLPRLVLVVLTAGLWRSMRTRLAARGANWRLIRGLWARSADAHLQTPD
jgi:GT2 family glycosyltransferase